MRCGSSRLSTHEPAYTQLMDRVASANFAIWSQLVDAAARQGARSRPGSWGLFGGNKSGTVTRVERELVVVEVNGEEFQYAREALLGLNNVPGP